MKLGNNNMKSKTNILERTNKELCILHDILVGGNTVRVREKNALRAAIKKVEIADTIMHAKLKGKSVWTGKPIGKVSKIAWNGKHVVKS